MKREHIKSESYIDWLKSLGCVFYAPLDQENGLTDLISGTIGTVQHNNSAVWNNNENAYLFTKDSAYNPKQGIVIWQNLGMDLATTNPEYSVLYNTNITRYGNSWNGSPDDAASTINVASGDRSIIITPQEVGITKNSWYSYGAVLANESNVRIFRCYLDGVFKRSYNYGTVTHTITSNDKNTLYINLCVNHQGYTNAIFYMHKLMLFNTALDLTTIRKIQGYE